MPPDTSYLTPARMIRCRFTVQDSRFIATLAPVRSEAEALQTVESARSEYPDATHHTYACRIGSCGALIERAFDDREPAGSAGAPMLQVLQGKNISDAVVVGTRYFGGTRLGLGGLARAYRDCARFAVEKARLEHSEPMDGYLLKLAYEDLGAVNRVLESRGAEIKEAGYLETVLLKIEIPRRLGEALVEEFTAACRGRGSWEKL